MPFKTLFPPVRPAILTLVLAGALVTIACAENSAQEKAAPVPKAPASAAVWEEATSYDLYTGKAEDTAARFFQSPDYQKILIVPGTGEQAFVIALKPKQVSSIPRAAFTTNLAGAAIPNAASLTAVGAATQNGADLSFKAGKQEFRLTPEPPILGETTRDALLKKKGDYALSVQSYQPKNAAVALLKSISQPVEVKIFFGTWCSFCKKSLPAYIKTLDAAGNANIRTQYIGLDEGMSEPEALITQYAISKTPTFVVLVDGKEAGRIVEEPKQSIEEDLVLILMGK